MKEEDEMGYTHYYYTPKEIDAQAFLEIAEDVKKLAEALKKEGVRLAGGLGEGEPVIDENIIWFNGTAAGGQDHETFLLSRAFDSRYPIKDENTGLFFNFCKTNHKPYDLAVTSALVAAKYRLGESVLIRSDGGERGFEQAKEFCQKHLGYGDNVVVTAPVEEEEEY